VDVTFTMLANVAAARALVGRVEHDLDDHPAPEPVELAAIAGIALQHLHDWLRDHAVDVTDLETAVYPSVDEMLVERYGARA
jgi:hypothetical protein